MSYRTLLMIPAFALSGCTGPVDVDTGPDAPLLFLVQRSLPASSLEALYQGRVVVDQEGCLRLAQEPDRHTVVWPFGFRLASDQASLVVLDEGGKEVARIGALLRLSGGEVPQVPDENILTPALAAAALARCPGRFWIVGEVLPTQPR